MCMLNVRIGLNTVQRERRQNSVISGLIQKLEDIKKLVELCASSSLNKKVDELESWIRDVPYKVVLRKIELNKALEELRKDVEFRVFFRTIGLDPVITTVCEEAKSRRSSQEKQFNLANISEMIKHHHEPFQLIEKKAEILKWFDANTQDLSSDKRDFITLKRFKINQFLENPFKEGFTTKGARYYLEKIKDVNLQLDRLAKIKIGEEFELFFRTIGLDPVITIACEEVKSRISGQGRKFNVASISAIIKHHHEGFQQINEKSEILDWFDQNKSWFQEQYGMGEEVHSMCSQIRSFIKNPLQKQKGITQYSATCFLDEIIKCEELYERLSELKEDFLEYIETEYKDKKNEITKIQSQVRGRRQARNKAATRIQAAWRVRAKINERLRRLNTAPNEGIVKLQEQPIIRTTSEELKILDMAPPLRKEKLTPLGTVSAAPAPEVLKSKISELPLEPEPEPEPEVQLEAPKELEPVTVRRRRKISELPLEPEPEVQLEAPKKLEPVTVRRRRGTRKLRVSMNGGLVDSSTQMKRTATGNELSAEHKRLASADFSISKGTRDSQDDTQASRKHNAKMVQEKAMGRIGIGDTKRTERSKKDRLLPIQGQAGNDEEVNHRDIVLDFTDE